MNNARILYLFTRTPLHVGAGASVGAIDQPIIRERHTGFPIIPATTLKGVFADEWTEIVSEKKGTDGKEIEELVGRRVDDGKWLFGETDANNAVAGALQFSEAKLLAFPVRSAKGSFAWITSPLILRRFARDIQSGAAILPVHEPADAEAIYAGPALDLGGKIVLEEYTFTQLKNGSSVLPLPDDLKKEFGNILSDDPVWKEVASRLVIVSDGMMSFFAQNACEVAQHVRINDATGTAAGGALFNQENVPSETLFYTVLNFFDERSRTKKKEVLRPAAKAVSIFDAKLSAKGQVFQFGGDASTGLGFCTVALNDPSK
ncbi:MAG: type III-B CRISPR module RAMP protein Cmr4 [Verrucomicrobiia bacterium]